MKKLSALTSEKHKTLRISGRTDADYAQSQHMMQLQVAEIAAAIINFPVFISRVTDRGDLALSALASFTPGRNLFVVNDLWQSVFRPSAMQTHPFYLMKGEGDAPIVGVDETSPLFSSQEGEALFDSAGKPSLFLNRIETQLMDSIKNVLQTQEFLKTIDQHGLILPVSINLHYAGGEIAKVAGLNAINEDKLKSLGANDLKALSDSGYLGLIYAILFSLGQLNALIRLTNQSAESKKIEKISLEVVKDERVL